MKRVAAFLVLFLFLAVGFWAFRAVTGRAALQRGEALEEIPTAPVRRGKFEITLMAVGEIATAKSLSVTAPFRGKIVYLADEGYVKKGELLVALDTTDLEEQRRKKQLEVELAEDRYRNKKREVDLQITQLENKLADARSDVEIARAAYEERKRAYERTQKMVERGLYPRVRLEEAEFALLQAEKNLRKAERKLREVEKEVETRKNMLLTDLKSVESEWETRKRELEDIERKIRSAKFYAPTSGLVIHASAWRGGNFGKVQVGDETWPGQVILTFPDTSEILSIMKVEEARIQEVQLGQKVRVRVEALPGRVYTGTVIRKGDVAITQLRRRRFFFSGEEQSKGFEVRVRIEDADDRLRPGMTTRNEIILQVVEDAVYVPLEAVFEKDGQSVVFVREGDGYRVVPVRLGPRSDVEVQILEGLRGDEEVLLADPTQRAQRWKPQKPRVPPLRRR